MKITCDHDALYFRLVDSPIVESGEVAPGIVLDFDENNQVVVIDDAPSVQTRPLPRTLHVRIHDWLTLSPSHPTQQPRARATIPS